jgi:orotidine-5'-phosphate decarboxylase
MAALSQRRRVYVHYEGQNGPYRDPLAISARARGAEGSVKSEVAVSRAFGDRLIEAARANDSLLCVGLDPVRSRLPSPLDAEPDLTRAIVSFNTGVIAATSDLVCAYKPNLGFYLAYGAAGVAALEETRRLIPAHIPVILDAKVGDIGSTAEAYATGYFDTWDFDAVTVNPYLGEDSLAPFLSRGDRGVIVVCKTSNPGSADLQNLSLDADHGRQPLYLTVAERVAAWAERWPATLGLVVGATYPAELAEVRRRCPDAPILLPGIGAQAGDLEASLRSGLDNRGLGLIVSSSRSVIYAGKDQEGDWTAAVRATALELRGAINGVRAAQV